MFKNVKKVLLLIAIFGASTIACDDSEQVTQELTLEDVRFFLKADQNFIIVTNNAIDLQEKMSYAQVLIESELEKLKSLLKNGQLFELSQSNEMLKLVNSLGFNTIESYHEFMTENIDKPLKQTFRSLTDRGVSKDVISRAMNEHFEAIVYSKTSSNNRTTDAAVDACVNQAYYCYSLDNYGCIYGYSPGSAQDWCLTYAHYQLTMAYAACLSV